MMHICYITADYPIPGFAHGGIGTFTRNLGYELVRKHVVVSVIRLAKVDQAKVIDDQGVRVYVLPEARNGVLKFLSNAIAINRKLDEVHRKNPIAIVETPELGLAFVKKNPQIKYLIRMHGGHHFFAKAENRKTEWRKVWQEKKSFSKADHILAVSEYVAQTTRDLLHLGHREITVIYNPIDTARFYEASLSKIVPHRLFFAGAIVEKKGVRQLIQSLEYLVDDYPDLKLYLAGKDANIPGTSKPYRPVLDAAISDKVRPHVLFLGAIPNFEIPNAIEQAQICCYPSHMEAMPLAWLEVLAMGKVFLGSNTGPGPEAVLENETGYLVDPHDPQSIAKKIRYIFEHYDEALLLAKNARQRVVEQFDVAVLVDRNMRYYRSLID